MEKVRPQPALEPEPGRKLHRLPHVFNRELELPLPMKTIVHTYFTPKASYYIVPRGTIGEASEVKVRIARIEPLGFTRVVVHLGPREPDLEDDLVYDKYRARLSKMAIPSMTVADYVNGNLVVTVPNGEGEDEVNENPVCLNKGKGDGEEAKGQPTGGASKVSAI